MEIWIDAQLSPILALWINQSFNAVHARSMRSLGLQTANDEEIFLKAKTQKAIIMSKDIDFVKILERYGAPPQIIWITVGNTSNANMRKVLGKHFPIIIKMLKDGEPLIEIQGI